MAIEGGGANEPVRRKVVVEEEGGSRRDKVLRIAGIALSLLLLAFLLLWSRCGLKGCPDVDTLKGYMPDEASVVLDENGDEVGKLYQVNRTIIPLDSLPEYVPNAFVAAEDKRFWKHNGVDWQRVPGAALANVKSGGVAEGFSTITMQLSRNLFPDRLPAQQQTLWRKLGEMRVARDIERKYSKREILQMYVNQIYFGNGAWGIEAASEEYFGKPASELKLSEAATIAGILPAPSRLNPRSSRDRAKDRRELVLSRMVDQGFITQAQADEAREVKLDLARSKVDANQPAPYFVEAVRQELEDVFGTELYTEGFRIHTTLDLDVQEAAQQQLRDQLAAIESGRYGTFRHPVYDPDTAFTGGDSPYLQGAVVVMDATTGGVLALVGGRDFDQSKFNRALQAERQPGSAFKPFVYATALARGYPPSTMLDDSPVRLTLSGGRVWEPKNYGDSYSGRITMREALVHSKNVATVRLSQMIGVDNVLRTARVMGLDGDLPNVPAVVLGAGEVKLIDLVAAYGAFATLGDRPDPHFVTSIEDRNGNVLWSREPRSRRVIEPAVAFLVTNILEDVVNRGTATAVRGAGFRGAAAGKTGTTNDGADAWFLGYTPRVVGGVWIGFDDPQQIIRGATGGGLAAPVWARVVSHVKQRGGDWVPPTGVEQRQVDQYGNVLASNCPTYGDTHQEWFLSGTAPMAQCSYPEGFAYDSGYWNDSLGYQRGTEDDDGWFARLRRRLFGDEDENRQADTLPRPGNTPHMRPGRPEDTIPMYRQPQNPAPTGTPITPQQPQQPQPTTPQPAQPQPTRPQPARPTTGDDDAAPPPANPAPSGADDQGGDHPLGQGQAARPDTASGGD